MFKNFKEFLGSWNKAKDWAAKSGLLFQLAREPQLGCDYERLEFRFGVFHDLFREILRLEREEKSYPRHHMEILSRLFKEIFVHVRYLVNLDTYRKPPEEVARAGRMLLARDIRRCASAGSEPRKRAVHDFLERCKLGWKDYPDEYPWWLHAVVATRNFKLVEDIHLPAVAETMRHYALEELEEHYACASLPRPTEITISLLLQFRQNDDCGGQASCNETKERAEALVLHLARTGQLNSVIQVVNT